MKMLFLLVILLVGNATIAQVGIGTNSPSTNAVLDVSSTNKGILLPRVNDTTLVSNPSAGLMIYNKATRSPAFHDGTAWNTIATRTAATTANTDSLTYTITGATGSFVNGTYKLINLSHGIANSGTTSSFQDVAFTKTLDINSIAFTKAVAASSPLQGIVIEIKAFVPGALTPYYSIKLSNNQISSFNLGISTTGFSLSEQITISSGIYGYKDWINNVSFSYNTGNKQVGTY